MDAATASARGLQDALARCERAVVNFNARGTGTGGSIEVLLTPNDVAKRHLRDVWHLLRPKFYLGPAARWKGAELADGIAAGAVGFPDMCARCLGEPTRGIVFEMLGGSLGKVSGRWSGDKRSLIAANTQRIWYSVPFCDVCADQHRAAISFGETMFDSGWIAFRNSEYGAAFGELNGVMPRTAVRRYWPAPVALILILTFIGVLELLAYFGVMKTEWEPTTSALVAGVVLLALAIIGIVILYRTVLGPWRQDWRSGRTLARAPTRSARHERRPDGYCAYCFEPWPCTAARDASE